MVGILNLEKQNQSGMPWRSVTFLLIVIAAVMFNRFLFTVLLTVITAFSPTKPRV